VRYSIVAMKKSLALAVLLLGRVASTEDRFPPAIEDNSFLLEEAYNQDAGVVQHISTFTHFRTPEKTSDFGFTQEWPVGSERHQLSYTIPYSWVPGDHAFGDIFLNYRLQLRGADSGIALAQRLSILVPTSDGTRGGVQANLAGSRRVSAHLALHGNAGATWTRRALASESPELRRDLLGFNLGASAIGIVNPHWNVMLEAATFFDEQLEHDGSRVRTTQTTLAPGVRTSIDRGSLQIVPGFGIPITIGDGRTDAGGYLYLSFEHPFRKK
jgi:hypothetical protein